jgi:hypothetical protein
MAMDIIGTVPTPAPEPQAASPAAIPPVVGGGLAAMAPAGLAATPGASPAPAPAPAPAAPQQTLEQMAAALLAQPAGAPAATAAAAVPAAGPTIEQLQAELAAARAKTLSDDELAAMRHWAQLGQQSYQQQLAARQQPAAPAAPAPAAQPQTLPNGVIPFNEQDKYWLERDDTSPLGVKARVGAPPDLMGRYQAHVDSTRKFYSDLAQNPMAVLGPLIEAKAREIAASQIQATNVEQQQAATTQKILAENREWIFQKDPTQRDGVARDLLTGRPKFTPEGDIYYGWVERAASLGVSDPAMQHEIARGKVVEAMVQKQQAALQQRQVAPAAPVLGVAAQLPASLQHLAAPVAAPAPVAPAMTVEQLAEAQKNALLARAAQQAAQAPVSSYVPPTAPTPHKSMSLMELSRQVAAQQGIAI